MLIGKAILNSWQISSSIVLLKTLQLGISFLLRWGMSTLNRHGHIKGARLGIFPPAQQADAVLNQANPVSETAYTVLATTKNVRVISITVSVAWTVQPTPLEIVVTIDGQTIIWTFTNPVTGTDYYAGVRAAFTPTTQPLDANDLAPYRAFLLEGRSVKIEARTTGGTVSGLYATVKYAKW